MGEPERPGDAGPFATHAAGPNTRAPPTSFDARPARESSHLVHSARTSHSAIPIPRCPKTRSPSPPYPSRGSDAGRSWRVHSPTLSQLERQALRRAGTPPAHKPRLSSARRSARERGLTGPITLNHRGSLTLQNAPPAVGEHGVRLCLLCVRRGLHSAPIGSRRPAAASG
eukprot:scaffold1132_cov377-Prasinococcus_capsulatus_cf.AAC.5